jgi:hypothetical protein
MRNTIKIIGNVKAVLRNAKTGQIKQVVEGKNIIATVGLTAILRRLGNDAVKTNEGMITYGAVGDGATNPALTDTVMENEIDRKAVGVTTVVGTTLTIETFFAEAEGIGTLSKFALFGEDATTVGDTGTLFEYIKFDSPINKTILDVLTVTSELVIANA